MPTRRSDRGRMLAKLIREEPDQLKSMAEFTEPYGTISAMQTIAEGDAGPLDYMAAIPVVGGVARAAKKGKKAVDALGDPVAAFRRTADSPMVGNRLYDELDFLDPDMSIEEFGEEVAYNMERLSPEAKRLLRALDKDDWLGFDNPSQALDAVMRDDLDRWDPSPGLKAALGAYHNKSGGF